jgi:CHAT domain-containing protein/tetratricopeptide (TPR) repeat protein
MSPRVELQMQDWILAWVRPFLGPAGAVLLAWGTAQPAHAGEMRCAELLEGPGKVLERHWVQRGGTTVQIDLPPAAGHDLLVRVMEDGVDVAVEFQDANGHVVGRTDSPIERRASQYAYLPASGLATVALMHAKEPAQITGEVGLYVSTLPHSDTKCAIALKEWAEADSAYAGGREIALAREASSGANARNSFESAAQKYRAALEALTQAANISDQGELQLSAAAVKYYELQDWSGSADLAAQAVETFAQNRDTYMKARALGLLAAAWMEVATKSSAATRNADPPPDSRQLLDRARSLLRELAAFHAGRNEPYEEALQINNIGVGYGYEARLNLALPYFARAKIAFERLGETSRVAVALQNQALCEWGLGHLGRAMAKFDQALQIMRPSPYPDLYLLTLNNSGLAHYAAGHFDEALRLQTEALEFATRSQSDRARARSYYGIGVTYYAIGDSELATRFLNNALEISTAQSAARQRAVTLRALAVVEHENGQLPEAIAHNSEALTLATAPLTRARILLHLAGDYADAGDPARALNLITDLLSHPPGGDPLVRGMALEERGTLSRLSGDYAGSERDLLDSIGVFVKYDSLADRFEAEVKLAQLRADQHRPDDALAEVRRALSLSREIRAQTANPEYRASIARALRPALDFEIGLLRARYDEFVRRGQLANARLAAIESLKAVDDFRAQGFDDWRAERFGSPSDGSIQGLMNSSATLYRDMAERRSRLAALEDTAGPLDPRAAVIREQIGRLRVRAGIIDAQLAARTSKIPVSPREAPTATNWFAQIQSLPPDRALVEYWLGSAGAYAWVVTASNISWMPLAASTVIDRAARIMHVAMSSADVSTAARLNTCDDMYRLVLAPIANSISTAREIIVVPDAALHYVPFAALRSGMASDPPFLAQSLIISMTPALRLVGGGARVPAGAPRSNRVLIVADPIYTADDPRLSQLSSSQMPAAIHPMNVSLQRSVDSSILQRLASTGREAAQISSLYAPQDVDVLQGADATRSNVLAKDLATYRFIHIASHGIVDAEIPQLSALILGKYDSNSAVSDPYLRVSDLLAKTFNAQAVVLSACDTALGKEFAGEGIIGLRYAALARGAHAVVASLWSVPDGVSADLMTDLYRHMGAADTLGQPGHRAPLSVAASLAEAMREVLRNSPSLDPAFWAPFTVYVAGD